MERIRRIVIKPVSPRPSRIALCGLLLVPVVVAACAYAWDEADPTTATAPITKALTADGGEAVAETAAPTETDPAVKETGLPPEIEPYRELFSRAGCTHSVDPELLAAIALAESNGDPLARSPLGARGLMQIMPMTAAEIAAARGVPDHAEEKLDDPAYSIDMAAWYLARQLDRFGHDVPEVEAVTRVASAYNAGPERFDAHLTRGAALSEETLQYRERVVAWWEYLRESWTC
jgi:soluble lytic murein transglycosylase-like protein